MGGWKVDGRREGRASCEVTRSIDWLASAAWRVRRVSEPRYAMIHWRGNEIARGLLRGVHVWPESGVLGVFSFFSFFFFSGKPGTEGRDEKWEKTSFVCHPLSPPRFLTFSPFENCVGAFGVGGFPSN